MTYCGEQTLSTTVDQVKTAVSLRCRSWGCGDCAPQRRSELVAVAQAGKPDKLLTLTSRRREGCTPEAAARQLVAAWRLIRRRWHKMHPDRRIEFIAFFEETQLGWPHLHILLRGPYLPQKLLSIWMKELTGSPIVDIRAVGSTGHTARYVTKYTTKGLGKFGTLKRYWKSKNYENSTHKKEKGKHQWDRQDMTLQEWCQMWRSFGFEVKQVSRWKAEARKQSGPPSLPFACANGPPTPLRA